MRTILFPRILSGINIIVSIYIFIVPHTDILSTFLTGKNAKPLSTSKVLLACVNQLGIPLINRQIIRIKNMTNKPTILAAFSIPAHSQTITADSRTVITIMSVKSNAIHKGIFEEWVDFISRLTISDRR